MVEASPLLFCDLAYVEPVSSKTTLMGIFTGLRANRFPSPFRSFTVFAMVRGDPGENGSFGFACIDAETDEVLYQEPERYVIFTEGHETLPLTLPISEFRFPQQGWYRFVLTFAGETIAENKLFVREVS